MSRRRAEQEIEAGKILVNGQRAELGSKIDPETDSVTYNGKQVKPAAASRKVYLMLNKPVGYVTTLSDEKGRPCVSDLVKDVGVRVWPCGRLDMYSEGLLILTNDGELTNALTHPVHDAPKLYHVRVAGKTDSEMLRRLSQPMTLDDGYVTRPVKTEVVTMKEEYTVLRMELYEGRNRQIRQMCEQTGLKVLRLCRVAIGTLKLGNLAPGRWRHLTASQVQYLKSFER